jgi:aminopeptidase N
MKSPVMSTYLLAWAVGEFDLVAGVTKVSEFKHESHLPS